MAGRLAGDQHAHTVFAAVHCLVPLSRSDLKALARAQSEVALFDFESQFSFEDIEELARMNMRMTDFARAGRHQFFNHAECGRLEQMPAVAVRSARTSPRLVFRGTGAYDLGRHIAPFKSIVFR